MGDFNEEKLHNLRNVHSDEEDQQKKRRKAGHLPSNREVLEKLLSIPTERNENELSVFFKALVAVEWSVNRQKKWYVGYVIDVNEGICTIEHMEGIGQENEEWRYPGKEESFCEIDVTKIVSIQPEYEWDILSVRVQKLLLKSPFD